MSMIGAIIVLMLILLFVIAKVIGTNVRQDTSLSSLGSCSEFSDEDSRNKCLRSLALQNLDIIPCLQIRSIPERDACLRNVAIRTRDFSLCAQISTPSIRDMCSSEID
ncbi:MAG: hypothetical protein ABIG39_02330 [Candidatus Micrarchaeota archaeon]